MSYSGTEIAIVGLAGRYPRSENLSDFWRQIREGKELVTFLSEEELARRGVAPELLKDPRYVKAASVLEGMENFDASFFGIPPQEAALMDPQHRHFLECAWEALEDAGYDPQRYPGRVGVYAGAAMDTYLLYNLMRNPVAMATDTLQIQVANDKDYLPTRVSYKLNLRGPSHLVQSACSSSLVATHVAVQALLNEECDVALVGGASVLVHTRDGYLHKEGGVASADGHCRSFDADASGTIFASGVGCVMLKPLDRALADGDHVYAIILGTAVNNDGNLKVGFMAPSAEGVSEVVLEAMGAAGISADSIGYVEAHGTGTPLGDPIEVQGLTRAWRQHTQDKQFCALGSVKSNVGHLDAASGVTALIKTAFSLRDGIIPPSLHYRRPNPAIDFPNSPFFVNDRPRPWQGRGGPRRAGVSSLGIGGTNAHVILEEPPRQESAPAAPYQLLVLSARTQAALERATDNLADHLERHPDANLADVAFTLQTGRQHFAWRRCLVARDVEDALRVLDASEDGSARQRPSQRPSVAFLFSGQGSQYAGMAANLYAREPVFREHFDACAQRVRTLRQADLRSMVMGRDGTASDERLRNTEWTQPALFAVEYALARLLMHSGLKPDVLLGHSIGEYVAACLAGVFSLEDALTLVCERGRLMAGLPAGSMLSVPLTEEALQPHLADGKLSLAAVNAPGRCVVAGPTGDIEALERRLEAQGVRARRLQTSHAFHSAMMDPILEEFTACVRRVERKAPKIPILSNLTGRPLEAAEATSPEYWARHLRGTVRFSQGVRQVLEKSDRLVLEVGPGNALTTFALQHTERAQGVVVAPTLPHAQERERDVPVMLEALGKAWQAGVDVDWKALRGNEKRLRVSLPTYPFERERHWLEPMLGGGLMAPAASQERTASRDGQRPELAVAFEPPRDELERSLADLWSELLGVTPVGIHDNFFDLGGNSVTGFRFLSSLRGKLGVELPVQELFAASTISRLAERVRAREATPALPSLTRAPREGVLPLSPAQQRLWLLDQMEPGQAAYNMPAVVRISGRMDVEALRRSFEEIVRRHEVLRTTFAAEAGKPQARIQAPASWELPITSLESHAEHERQAEALRQCEAEARRPFHLETGPLLRTRLLRLSETEHLLSVCMHHIASDGWSMGVLIREAVALYEAFSKGQPSPLPELAVQYVDFAAWQQQWLRGEKLEELLAYWTEQLAGAPHALELPTDKPRPPVQSFRGAQVSVRLPQALSTALESLCQKEGVTPFMALLATFQVLLHRYSGQEDFLVGFPIAGRRHGETEGLVGFFINTLVLRARLAGRDSFRELLGRVREAALGAYAHQDVPFERLVEKLQPQRDRSRSPLFQVSFTLQNTPSARLELPGLSFELLETHTGTAKHDLSLLLSESPQGLTGTLEYNADLYEQATVERMAGHLRVLLEAVTASPETPLARLPLLTEPERRKLLVEWNDTAAPYPADACIHQLFEAQVERSPDAIAVTFEGTHLTYRQLNARANQLAHHLRSLSAGPDILVGLCVEPSLELVVGMLGILKAGSAWVPLDPSYPAERLALMLRQASCPLLLTREALADELPSSGEMLVCFDTDAAVLARQPETNLPSLTRAENLAYVIFTSGSTGTPKGVQVSHRGVANLAQAQAQAFQVRPGSRVLQFASFSFDAAVSEVAVTLLAGATLCLARRESLRPGPELLTLLREQAITTATLPPSLLAVLPAEEPGLLPVVISAGEACPPEVLARWATGSRRFINAYGPTEVTVCATLAVCTPDGQRPPIGRPLSNVRLYVLDANLRPVPVGVAGELYVGSVGLARGYLRQPDLTAERFVPDPFGQEPGARLYRTGDQVRYRPDGQLEFLGRTDTQVKVRGFRIETGDIESHLLQHPALEQAVVAVREDVPGDKRLVAYVTPADGAPDASELRAFLQKRLPEYMVPSAFVALEQLPLSPNGKVDRKALPAPDAAAPRTTYVEPRTATEQQLAALWAEVLACPKVGLEDDFFELGGHSLLATQVLSRVRATFEVELPLQALFDAPTVGALATRIDAARQVRPALQAPPLKRVPRDGALPLSFAQQRLWFLDQFEPGSAAYNIPAALRMEGNLDVAALQRSFEALLQRHESLRTTFVSQEGTAVQVIQPASSFPLPVVDLESMPATEREASLRRLITEDAARSFDLGKGPLLRATLLRLGEQQHVLLLTMHHIVSDGWSVGVLVREMTALYLAFTSGQTSSLPELPLQYADYAVWQRSWLQGEALASQLDWWKQHLAGAPQALELPTDFPRPSVQSFSGAAVPIQLPESLSRSLRDFCQKEGVTPFMALLGAFQALLARYSGQDDIVVGSPIAGRRFSELEGLLGFFVNTLALRSRARAGTSFRQLLRQVREATLGAYAHQDVPFEKLVEELQPRRDMGRTPLFQVLFALQNAPAQPLSGMGLSIQPLPPENDIARFDLELNLAEAAGNFSGTLVYNTALFRPETAQRLSRYFVSFLQTLLSQPEQPFHLLPLLPADELRTLLVDWAGPSSSYPRDSTIPDVFSRVVAASPNAIALEAGDSRFTYAQLDALSNQLAHLLLSRGVRPDSHVALALERTPQLIISLLAILKAGAAYVPLDTSYPPERLALMLEDAQPVLLLTSSKLLSSLPAGATPSVLVDREDTSSFPTSAPAVALSPLNLAYIDFTSGSTGRPKGVCIHHHSVLRTVLDVRYADLSSQHSFLLIAPISFDASTLEVWGPLLNGARLVLFPHDASPSDLDLLCSVLERHSVSTLHLTAGLFSQAVDSHLEGLRPVRQLLTGGDVVSPPHVRKVLESLHLPVTACYGPTEGTLFTSCHRMTSVEHVGSSVPIGTPISNTQVYLLDASFQPVPPGTPGELFISGDGLARGYLRSPHLTAERFLPNPFSNAPGARMYRTGDLARWRPDGVLEFLGRADFQVKVRGFRIELAEVEAALRSFPGVREAVAMAREDVPGDKRLVGYVTADSSLDTSALRSFLLSRLPEFMVPSALVRLDSFPLTANAKIDRKALPAPDARPDSVPYVAPRDDLEQQIADLWAEVLRVERVGVTDDFFALGGHSLLATQLVARVRSTFQVELPLRELFGQPTVEAMAMLVLEGLAQRVDSSELDQMVDVLADTGDGTKNAANE